MRNALLSLVGAAWLCGAAIFLRADGSVSWTLERLAEPPVGEHNLAHYRFGPTLRASSYYRDALSQHHPIFLVDGRDTPHQIEKWTSGFHDAEPWLEIGWREPRTLSRVVVRHGGWREHAAFTTHRYLLTCLRDDARGPIVSVTGNAKSVASHALPCERARGVRIAWTPNEPDEKVRAYEVEAWGH